MVEIAMGVHILYQAAEERIQVYYWREKNNEYEPEKRVSRDHDSKRV